MTFGRRLARRCRRHSHLLDAQGSACGTAAALQTALLLLHNCWYQPAEGVCVRLQGLPVGQLGGDKKGGNAEITPLQVDPSVSFDTVGGLDHYIRVRGAQSREEVGRCF